MIEIIGTNIIDRLDAIVEFMYENPWLCVVCIVFLTILLIDILIKIYKLLH